MVWQQAGMNDAASWFAVAAPFGRCEQACVWRRALARWAKNYRLSGRFLHSRGAWHSCYLERGACWANWLRATLALAPETVHNAPALEY